MRTPSARATALLAALLLAAWAPGVAQPFEGVITYRVSYSSKVPTVTSEQLARVLGTSQTYSIKGGRYRNDQDGLLMNSQVYDPSTNRLYNKTSQSNTWFWRDGGQDTDTLLSSTLRRDSTTVLGIRCHALVMRTRQGTQTVFYAADGRFAYDVRAYRRHRFGLFSTTARLTGCVPLRIVNDVRELRIELTAESIEPRALTEAHFALPEGAVVEPAPR